MPTIPHAQHAAQVPVYVRAAGDAWELADTESAETLSTHDTARKAGDAALEIGLAVKRANLREEGEPIGAWRWLDASAEEDEPVGDSRITASAIWEMAAGLNARASAIPINGGGAPRAGLGDSVPHGDAYTGGDHLANGYAHAGLPVVDESGRTHLYLRAELLPEIAREIDLGRLAYGSIRFGFDEADEADNFGVKGAVLISHALTNDPAVTTLTAGSERRRESEPAHVAMRSRRLTMANQTTKRGPAMDVLKKIAATLSVEIADEMEGDTWCSPIMDAISALKNAAKVEAIVEGGETAEPPAKDPAATGAETAPRAAVREDEERAGEPCPHCAEPCVDCPSCGKACCPSCTECPHCGAEMKPAAEKPEPAKGAAKTARAEDGADEMQAHHDALVTWGREVLDKPDATPAEVVKELEARKAEVGAALGTDTPESDDGDGGPVEEESAEARAQLRAMVRDPKASARDVRAAARKLAAQLDRAETREWLDAEIVKRSLALTPKQRERYAALAITGGRVMVAEILADLTSPPRTDPMAGAAPAASRSDQVPQTQEAAYDACMTAARDALDGEEAERAKRERRQPYELERHVIRARAQKLAHERFAELFVSAPAAR